MLVPAAEGTAWPALWWQPEQGPSRECPNPQLAETEKRNVFCFKPLHWVVLFFKSFFFFFFLFFYGW